MPIRLRRPLPGEIEGRVDPERYGFEVIKDEPQSEEDALEDVRELYEAAKARTGRRVQRIEEFLEITEAGSR